MSCVICGDQVRRDRMHSSSSSSVKKKISDKLFPLEISAIHVDAHVVWICLDEAHAHECASV